MRRAKSVKVVVLGMLMCMIFAGSVYPAKRWLRPWGRTRPKPKPVVAAPLLKPVVTEFAIAWNGLGVQFHLVAGEISPSLPTDPTRVIKEVRVKWTDYGGMAKGIVLFNEEKSSKFPVKQVDSPGTVRWLPNRKARSIRIKALKDNIEIKFVKVRYKKPEIKKPVPVKPVKPKKPVAQPPAKPLVQVLNYAPKPLKVPINKFSRDIIPDRALPIDKIVIKWSSKKKAAGFLILNNEAPKPQRQKTVKGRQSATWNVDQRVKRIRISARKAPITVYEIKIYYEHE